MAGWLRRLLPWVAAFGFVLVGCAEPSGDDASVRTAVRPRFELVEGAQPFGSLPFPDDLYLDPSGRVRIGAFPASVESGYAEVLRNAFEELDGFGAVSPVLFFFDGDLDPGSLPAARQGTTDEDAGVLLIDVDPSSPQLFTRIPVRAHFSRTRKILALRPADGRALVEGRKYAAVVLRSLRDTSGRPIDAAEAFAAIRDATQRPVDPGESRAYDHYQPVLASLERGGIERSTVAALSVFRVQSIASELLDARTTLLATSLPVARVKEVLAAGAALDARLGTPTTSQPGLDVPNGVAHDAIAYVVEGEFDAPSFLAGGESRLQPFARDELGRPKIATTVTIPFTLVIPKGVDVSALRLIVYGHDLGRERSDVFASADALAASGWALLAFDGPFQGLRHPRSFDDRNRLAKTSAPDGFGDFVDVDAIVELLLEPASPDTVIGAQPVYLRDFTRQATLDVVSVLRLVREGDLAAIRSASDALRELAFAAEPIGYLGVGLGGTLGAPLATLEPNLGPMLLVAPAGHLTQSFVASPLLGEFYAQFIFERLGIEPSRIDDVEDPPEYWPELALFQTLIDRGDPLAYAPYLRRAKIDVLLTMARDDEQVTNVGTESLARAIGAVIVGGSPRHAELDLASLPVRSNFEVESELVTRCLSVYEPATHSWMLLREDVQLYRHPLELPFEMIEPKTIANPIDRAIAQVVHFFETSRSGRAEVAGPAAW